MFNVEVVALHTY